MAKFNKPMEYTPAIGKPIPVVTVRPTRKLCGGAFQDLIAKGWVLARFLDGECPLWMHGAQLRAVS
jgi:hypothetical protein